MNEELSNKRPSEDGRPRFWRLFAIAIGGGMALSLLYALLTGPFTVRAISDALCTSALLLGAATLAPLLLDFGRSTVVFRRASTRAEMKEAMADERRKRERGMTVTFALGIAAVLLGVLAFFIGAL
jgi:hypothetical protein